MKKYALLTVLIMAVSLNLNAQLQKEYIPKNIFKVNLTALVLNNYMGQYERVLGKRVSVAISYRTMPESSVPFKSFILNQIDDPEGDAEEILNNLKLSNYAITPEIRFYMGKKGYGRGFYIAPFYRHSYIKGKNMTFDYDVDNQTHTLTMSGDIKGDTFGLMFGAQWSLAKNICLDWWILGPHVGPGKGTFKGVSTETLTTAMQDEIRRSLEDIDIPLYDKSVTVNSSGATMVLDGLTAGVRAGISLGIKF